MSARGGCHTRACHQRVAHKATTQRWKALIRPYRGWLDSTGMCESHGNYRTNTGNGFFGKYQFTLPTWRSVAPGRWRYVRPDLAPPLVQDVAAVRLLRRAGRGQWPVCG